MEIQGNDKHEKHMIGSAYLDGKRFVLDDGKYSLVRIQEASYKADKRKKEVDRRFPCLEYAHEKQYKQNCCAQKRRDAVDVHIRLL
jgi:hypothetical protein